MTRRRVRKLDLPTRSLPPHGPAVLALVVVVLAALAAPTPVAAQEAHAGHAMPMEDEDFATSTESIRLVDDPEAKELTIVLGPIDLPARSSHHMEQLPVQEGVVPFDLTIRSYRSEIYDGAGRPVPRVVLHHMNVLDPGRRELFLPIMLRVLAASHETPAVSLPGWLFGIPMRGGAPFWALAMLHNPTDAAYEDVTVHLVIGYERRERLPIYPMVPFHIDTMFPNTARKAFDLPPGATSRSYEASPAVRGLIVGLSGHLHRYATRLRLEDVTAGEVLYDARPEVDEDGTIERIPVLTHSGKGVGAPVFPDHVYRVTAEYFNPTEDVIVDGGMGAVAGGFIPLGDWPAANPGDPLYQADYAWVLESQAGHAEDGHGAHGAATPDSPSAAPPR